MINSGCEHPEQYHRRRIRRANWARLRSPEIFQHKPLRDHDWEVLDGLERPYGIIVVRWV